MVEAQEAPIIIVGAARSGTTYLVQILNHHPAVYITDETRIFVWAHEAMNRITQNQRVFFRERDSFISYLGGSLPELIIEFYRYMRPNLCNWGDKNPHYLAQENAGCLETILHLFPHARFIHIIRDGRDVVTSGLRGAWPDFEKVHQMWTSHVDNGRVLGAKLSKAQYFELKYEELIADDVKSTEEIFDFLGIEIHERVLEFCKRQREKRTPFCAPSRDIRTNVAASDWGRVLTAEQRAHSLELLGRHLIRYGYETEDSLGSIVQEVKACTSLS